MKYGLTQKFIKCTRERFQSGELTHEEAMWHLDYTYNDNLMSHIQDDCNKDKQVETLIKVLKNEN